MDKQVPLVYTNASMRGIDEQGHLWYTNADMRFDG